MMSTIHPSSIISGGVLFENPIYIGPNCFIGPNVRIGRGTRIEGFSSIGSRPEHEKYWHGESTTGVRIGENCTIREFTTINSGTEKTTTLGNGVKMLRGSHVGHDAFIDDLVNLSCNVLVGGHCFIGKGANLGLGAVIHQYRAIGAYSMVGMNSTVTHDIPPFFKAYGSPVRLRGLNKVGCERAKLDFGKILYWYEQLSEPLDFSRVPIELGINEEQLLHEWLEARV